MSTKQKTKTVKIVLIGDGAVGKTCMLLRYKDGTWVASVDLLIFHSRVPRGYKSVAKGKKGAHQFLNEVLDNTGSFCYNIYKFLDATLWWRSIFCFHEIMKLLSSPIISKTYAFKGAGRIRADCVWKLQQGSNRQRREGRLALPQCSSIVCILFTQFPKLAGPVELVGHRVVIQLPFFIQKFAPKYFPNYKAVFGAPCPSSLWWLEVLT